MIGGTTHSSREFVKSTVAKFTHDEPLLSTRLVFGDYNKDIVEPYYWHMEFPYYVGKGYVAIKIEDHHFFSENSQFGAGLRQTKGGAIRAYQENLTQLIQLTKVHLMPLLEEIKKAEFYKRWFDRIAINDRRVQEEMGKAASQRNAENLKKWRFERDSAINQLKDKWVTEVDGGRLYTLSRPATEQGLDFALLPTLFFGTTLDDPFEVYSTLQDQIDKYVESGLDISVEAARQVGRFLYKFHTWLPTAIRQTETTWRIKLASLKQFYTQFEMYLHFMKPLLLEIQRKSEGYDLNHFFRDFEENSPEFGNLFDYSYSFVKIMGVRGLKREAFAMRHLEISSFGLYIGKKNPLGRSARPPSEDPTEGNMIIAGPFKGKGGFLRASSHKIDKTVCYEFVEYDTNYNAPTYPSKSEFEALYAKWKESPCYVKRDELRSFPVIVNTFSQKRRNEIVQTQQGPQQVPYMTNEITYNGHVWNIFEVATFKEKHKVETLDLISSFVEEIQVIRDDLLKYANYLEGEAFVDEKMPHPGGEIKGKDTKSGGAKAKNSDSLILGPFQGLGLLFGSLIPNFGKASKVKEEARETEAGQKTHHLVNSLFVVEDMWKYYGVFKKGHGFMRVT